MTRPAREARAHVRGSDVRATFANCATLHPLRGSPHRSSVPIAHCTPELCRRYLLVMVSKELQPGSVPFCLVVLGGFARWAV